MDLMTSPLPLVRALLCLSVALLGSIGASAADLQATFIGNMAFHLTNGKTEILTDFPYQSGYSEYMTWAKERVPAVQGALCLITHGHRDHFAAELAKEYCTTLLGPKDVSAAVPDRVLALVPRVEHRGILIEPIATDHAKREHYSYLVTWAGLRLYFTGDTDDLEPLLRARDLDYAFVSPWLLHRAAKRRAHIHARQIVVYHQTSTEAVPRYQDSIVPAQGGVLRLTKAPSPAPAPPGKPGLSDPRPRG